MCAMFVNKGRLVKPVHIHIYLLKQWTELLCSTNISNLPMLVMNFPSRMMGKSKIILKETFLLKSLTKQLIRIKKIA
jgi:hypothetical protein